MQDIKPHHMKVSVMIAIQTVCRILAHGDLQSSQVWLQKVMLFRRYGQPIPEALNSGCGLGLKDSKKIYSEILWPMMMHHHTILGFKRLSQFGRCCLGLSPDRRCIMCVCQTIMTDGVSCVSVRQSWVHEVH